MHRDNIPAAGQVRCPCCGEHFKPAAEVAPMSCPSCTVLLEFSDAYCRNAGPTISDLADYVTRVSRNRPRKNPV